MKKELMKMRKEEKVSIKKSNANKKEESNRPNTQGGSGSVGGLRSRAHVNQKVRATKLRKM